MTQRRSRENSLWVWLRDAAPADLFMERVENAVSRGTADVLSPRFACELKSVARRPDGRVWCELRAEQAMFLRRWARGGGRAFCLVRVGSDRHYLVPAADCPELIQITTDTRLNMLSLCPNESSARRILDTMCGKYEIPRI